MEELKTEDFDNSLEGLNKHANGRSLRANADTNRSKYVAHIINLSLLCGEKLNLMH